jgi:hypothetical protein
MKNHILLFTVCVLLFHLGARSQMVTGTIPLKLVEFRGWKEQGGNQITWTTGTEMNSDFFELERSTDGKNFTKIAIVSVLGSGSTYQFTDNLIGGNALLYYRLKLVDHDLHYNYSKVVELREKPATVTLAGTYPNPFQSAVSVNLVVTKAQNVTLVLFDNSGQKIQQRTVRVAEGRSEQGFTGLDKLSSGVYLLQIVGEGVSMEQKLIHL